MVTRTAVTFQFNMGARSQGSLHTGSPADLYGRFYSRVSGYIPPLDVLNDKLATGIERRYEHGIHLRWVPVQISPAEYLLFCQDLRAKKYMEEIDTPAHIRSWDEWVRWIDSTAVPPVPVASTSAEEVALRKKYRKALVTGDAAAATALAAEIRRRFDPTFS